MTDVFFNTAEDEMERKHMNRKKSREGSDAGGLPIIKNSILGAACSLILMLALSLGFCWISYTRDDPDSLLSVLSFAALYISALVAGIISAKRTGNRGLVSGALSGIMLVGLLFLMSLCFGDSYSSGYSWASGMAMRGSVVLLSVLGGLIGVHKGNTKKRKRKRS